MYVLNLDPGSPSASRMTRGYMIIPQEQFEKIVAEAIDELPENFQDKLHNVALFVENFPNREQMQSTNTKSKWGLLGLFEGYAQAKKLNFGAVLPDIITIFREPIQRSCNDIDICRERIKGVVRHEIAHHLGLGEKGARKAEKRRA